MSRACIEVHARETRPPRKNPVTKPPLSPGLRMAIDYGPLAIFFAVNFLTPGLPIVRVIAATTVFIVATIAAMITSKVKAGHISPMLWLSGALIVVFGGLTIYFHDQRFIQMKPTIIYTMFAAILTFGLVTGRPLLQSLLGTAYPGLSADGWRKLTRNWAVFFAMLFTSCTGKALFSFTLGRGSTNRFADIADMAYLALAVNGDSETTISILQI